MKNLTLFLLCFINSYLFQAQETLKIDWPEEYNWQLLSNHEDEKLQVLEIIPKVETANNWSLLGQMMVIKGESNINMEKAKMLMFSQTQINAPNAKLTELEKKEDIEFPWILFKVECPNFLEDENPESQLWYITKSDNALYVNFIAKKKELLSPAFVDMWSSIFKKSKVLIE